MRKTIIFFSLILTLMGVMPLRAQDKLSDKNLEQKLTSLSNDSLKVIELSRWYKNNCKTHPELALKYTKLAINLSQNARLIDYEIRNTQRVGHICRTLGNYPKALEWFSKAEKLYRQQGDSIGIAKARNNYGIVYRAQGDYPRALENFFFSLKIFEAKNKNKLTALTLNNIGMVYKNLTNYSKALQYYKQSLELKLKEKRKPYLFPTYNNIANIYGELDQYAKALKYYNKGLEDLNDHPNNVDLARAHLNIGYTYYKMQKYDLALNHLSKNLKLSLAIGNKSKIAHSYDGLSLVYEAEKELDKALQYRTKCLSYAKQSDNLPLQRASHKMLHDLYCKLNQPVPALDHFHQYITIQDSLLNQERVHQIAEMQEKYESEKKSKQIALLEKENYIKQLQRNTLIVAIILIAVMFILFSRAYYIKKKLNKLLTIQKSRIERHRKNLEIKNHQLNRANQTKNKLFQIISHDLRSPLASVSGIAKLIPIFLKQSRYEELTGISDDLDNCVTRVLNLTDNLLSWSLSQSEKIPYTPETLDLESIILSNIETYQPLADQKKVQFEYQKSGSVYVFADKNMLETVLRNLINNALKYTSEYDLVYIGITVRDQLAEVIIKDTGIGIPSEKLNDIFEIDQNKSQLGTKGEKGNGLGLFLCKEFVTLNNGEISIDSQSGKGTTIRFTLPIVTSKITPTPVAQDHY